MSLKGRRAGAGVEFRAAEGRCGARVMFYVSIELHKCKHTSYCYGIEAIRNGSFERFRGAAPFETGLNVYFIWVAGRARFEDGVGRGAVNGSERFFATLRMTPLGLRLQPE